MKLWLIGTITLAAGFAVGFYVGGRPLYLLSNADGGPLKASITAMERQVHTLINTQEMRAKTPNEIVQGQVLAANLATTSAAESYCELAPELRVRARKAAALLSANPYVMQFTDKEGIAAREYLKNASETGSCEKFSDQNYKVYNENDHVGASH